MSPEEEDPPTGPCILIVEDNFLVAEMIKDALEDCGCRVAGPACSVREALTVASSQPLDGALLDINLNGELSFPVAQDLWERHVPFLFLTGYGSDEIIPFELRTIPRMLKPFGANDVSQIATQYFLGRVSIRQAAM